MRSTSPLSFAVVVLLYFLNTMVIKESKADRGGHPLSRGRGQRVSRSTKPAPPKETTPSQDKPSAAVQTPRGSPISNKLAKRALQPWSTLIAPQMNVQIGPSTHPLPVPRIFDVHTLPLEQPYFLLRSHFGTIASQKRLIVQRAGSPTCLSPRRAPFPSGRTYILDSPSVHYGHILMSGNC